MAKFKYVEWTPEMKAGARVIVSNDTRKRKVWFEAIYVKYHDGRHYVHYGDKDVMEYRFCRVDNWKYSWEK